MCKFLWAPLLAIASVPILLSAQAPASSACAISGAITASGFPLPGVAVAAKADGQSVDVSSSLADGSYLLKIPGPGHYTVSADLIAFAPLVREVEVDASSCSPRIDLVMTLASRAQAASQTGAPSSRPLGSRPFAGGAPAAAPRGTGGGRGGAQRTQFQSLELVADDSAGARLGESGSNDAGDASTQPLLPPGFSVESATEAVTSFGGARAAEQMPFGQFDPSRFGDGQFGGFGGGPQGRGGGPGGGPGGGGPMAFGGQGPGPGGGFGGPGPFAGRIRNNQIRGTVFQSFDSSGLDAAPFSLNNHPSEKASYFQQRFGATLGGPLTIPKLYSGTRTFFFLNYTGNHSNNPYDAYSTVPTLAMRAGDLSGIGRPIIDPSTGLPFPGNQIPVSQQNPSSLALLNLIPTPNQAGALQNFHYVTTVSSQVDDINLRLVHNFGTAPQRGQGGGRGGGGGGGRGGGRFGGGGGSNLNVTIHYRRSTNDSQSPFPTVGGTSDLSAWDIPVGFSFAKGGFMNSLRFDFNRQSASTQNLYAFSQDIAGQAGILGASTDPFDWGTPNLSFSKLTSLRDINPSMRIDRTLTVGDSVIKTVGKQTFRIGGDYRDIRFDSRTGPNARGSFVFTGLYTGLDFADFLLGLPQQSTVQYGAGEEAFQGRSWDVFAQDDWRIRDNLTLNLGLRYEYYSPFVEAYDRLVTLDVNSDFTAAVPVQAGQAGPFTGAFPATIVQPDRNNFAPRIGIAWRPKPGTVVRTGYGINYSAGVYQTTVQQLSAQPPFAFTNTVLATPDSPVLINEALTTPATVPTNSYGVDPNFRVPFVQIWNVDVQRDLTRTVTVGVGYIGTKGADLDLVRAPNRAPDGTLRIPDIVPFLWESAAADSIMNSATFRIRKRLTDGFAAGASYTLSKSIDDASSIGGGAVLVAQNDQDLAAERGLSSFDQRHRFSADFTYELPFGPNKRWANEGVSAALLGGWVWNGSVQLATGTPFTARVLGSFTDVATGVNGTLRANYNGAPIALTNPATNLYFNTTAFSIPPPGTFGDAGRNTIIGPGVTNMNLGLTRNITLGQNRVLSVQLMASNVFNTPQYSAIDTVVNSPTFGQITAARAPRRFQVVTRFRF